MTQRQGTMLASQMPTGLLSREIQAGYDPAIVYSAQALVAGCGALGQMIAHLLALIGFVRVTFVDMDAFEASNATRSPFYRPGAAKAAATCLGAAALCTAPEGADYGYFNGRVQELGDAGLPAAEKAIVFCAVDDPEARRWLAQRCRYTGVPLVEGGFAGARVNFSVFPNAEEDEPCWACGQGDIIASRAFSCTRLAQTAIDEGIVPATAPAAAGLAALMVEAGVMLLHDAAPLAHHTVFDDLRRGASTAMRRVRDPRCRVDHRVIYQEATSSALSPDDTIDALLAELEHRFDEPIAQMPASYVVAAPCHRCLSMTRVERPEWAVPLPLLCKPCGGDFETTEQPVPLQYGALSRRSSAAIAALPLRAAGVGLGMHLVVHHRHGTAVVRLQGDVHWKTAATVNIKEIEPTASKSA